MSWPPRAAMASVLWAYLDPKTEVCVERDRDGDAVNDRVLETNGLAKRACTHSSRPPGLPRSLARTPAEACIG